MKVLTRIASLAALTLLTIAIHGVVELLAIKGVENGDADQLGQRRPAKRLVETSRSGPGFRRR
jgi:hypothetical protein